MTIFTSRPTYILPDSLSDVGLGGFGAGGCTVGISPPVRNAHISHLEIGEVIEVKLYSKVWYR